MFKREAIWDEMITEAITAQAEFHSRREELYRLRLAEAVQQQGPDSYAAKQARESLESAQRNFPVATKATKDRAQREVDRARPFLEGLWAAMVILAQDPILED